MSVWEPIQIVEIIAPYCGNVFGTSPCTASAAAGGECYNTFATCQDTDNFTATTKSYFYCTPSVAARVGFPNVIPSLVSVSDVPTTLNFAGVDESFTGLGSRAVLSLRFQDHAHSDLGTDPYVSTRTYDPLRNGRYWLKWLARNKYRHRITVKLYEGTAGQSLEEMDVRTFFWDSNTYPTEDGSFSVEAKDVLAYLDEEDAQVPAVSTGELGKTLAIDATTITVVGAALADYDAAGTVRIDDEVMTYTSIAEVDAGLLFSGVVRGTDGTTAAKHDLQTRVQRCIRIEDMRLVDAVNLIVSDANEGNVPAAYLDTAQWDTEMDTYIADYVVSELLTEPRSIKEMLGELMTQTLTFFWWEEREALVKMRVIRGYSSEPDTLTDAAHIMPGLQIEERPDWRASRVLYYYRSTAATDDLFQRAYLKIDTDSEADNANGSARTRTIEANWVTKNYMAIDATSRYLQRFSGIPRMVTWTMDIKDRDYGVGDVVKLSHPLDVDASGARKVSTWLITEYNVIAQSGIVQYTAHDITGYGRMYYWMADDTPDYAGARVFESAYWGDDDGLLYDGTLGAAYA